MQVSESECLSPDIVWLILYMGLRRGYVMGAKLVKNAETAKFLFGIGDNIRTWRIGRSPHTGQADATRRTGREKGESGGALTLDRLTLHGGWAGWKHGESGGALTLDRLTLHGGRTGREKGESG